ncbi:MAG: aminoacyl-tRNA hydrolase [Bacteroidetes bacterium]|nr:MAG: aminoacyl-tRNA hydrolase [Bacteroidota bacterium]PTM12022.1 MAG: aminoacyl-tRNA hydrolase [Bacteroidota bacterium]
MDKNILLNEITFKATRSSGPGGQHVNKTSTRVELYWQLEESAALTEVEKERLRAALANQLSKEGQLVLSSGQTRSQLKNKQLVTAKFLHLLDKHIQPPKPRKRTRTPLAAKRKRLKAKKNTADKKALRRKPEL